MKPAVATAFVFAFSLIVSISPAVAAVETAYDNDTDGMVPGAATTDRNYTFGTHARWSAPAGVLPRWAERFGSRLGGAGPQPLQRFSLGFGQELYTPDKLSTARAITDDRPYAAWLFGTASISNSDATRERSLELRAGVVGPQAQGREVQTWWHRRNHIRLPLGWSHQLANEVAACATLDQRWRPWGPRRYADFVPHVRATVGTLRDELAVGATLRAGPRLPDDFGPGAPGGPEERVRGMRAYAFARGEGRAVARDLFLDGNTFVPSMRVHRMPFVAEAQMGAGLRWRSLGCRYTFSYTTAQFRERMEASEYGSLAIAF
jgi:hypothetical protein